MDSNRFDILTRSLSTTGSRRRALGGVLLGSLGLVGWVSSEEADAHNLLPSCKKKSGKAKKKCIKKAKAHNATHAVAPPAGDTGNRTPVDPCAGVSCGTVPHGMSACQNGVCVVTSCEGDFYDVDGKAGNGCEVADDGWNNHALVLAYNEGTMSCGVFRALSGKIVSDNRPHDPQPLGFHPPTGSAPDFWYVTTLCNPGRLDIDLVTSGGTSDPCYTYRIFTYGGSQYQEVSSGPISGQGSARRTTLPVSGQQRIVFSLEKTCPSSVREVVTYTFTLTMNSS